MNLSSNLKLVRQDVLRCRPSTGEAIQNYMNDAPADIGVADQPRNA